jgi:hypothetical protein
MAKTMNLVINGNGTNKNKLTTDFFCHKVTKTLRIKNKSFLHLCAFVPWWLF